MALPPEAGGALPLDHLAILRALLAARQQGGPLSVYRGPALSGGPVRPPDAQRRPLPPVIHPVEAVADRHAEEHNSNPFTRVPGRDYFTYARDAGVQPGQQLRFTTGLGYWVAPNAGGYRPF